MGNNKRQLKALIILITDVGNYLNMDVLIGQSAVIGEKPTWAIGEGGKVVDQPMLSSNDLVMLFVEKASKDHDIIIMDGTVEIVVKETQQQGHGSGHGSVIKNILFAFQDLYKETKNEFEQQMGETDVD